MDKSSNAYVYGYIHLNHLSLYLSRFSYQIPATIFPIDFPAAIFLSDSGDFPIDFPATKWRTSHHMILYRRAPLPSHPPPSPSPTPFTFQGARPTTTAITTHTGSRRRSSQPFLWYV